MELMERWASRSDAWTPEDDVTLAELVLQHIREGSTQLVAFEEAANLLGRTAAACGYRWNGVVRRHYDDAVKDAKSIRRKALEIKRHRRPNRTAIAFAGDKELTFDLLIRGLRDFERRYHEMQEKLYRLQRNEIGSAITTPAQLEADSKALLEILGRAKQWMNTDPVDKSVESIEYAPHHTD
jgi:prespore-specific regulator